MVVYFGSLKFVFFFLFFCFVFFFCFFFCFVLFCFYFFTKSQLTCYSVPTATKAQCLNELLCLHALVFLRQCLYGLLCLRLGFSVFVWTLILALAFLSVCMDSCACACISQCLYGLLCLRFSVFLWTLVLVFLSFFMDSCLCFSVFVWTPVLKFLSVCMDSCVFACVSQFLYGPLLRLRMRFSVFV